MDFDDFVIVTIGRKEYRIKNIEFLFMTKSKTVIIIKNRFKRRK